MTMRLAHMLMVFNVIVLAASIQRICENNDSLEDCSKRGKPQHYDRGKGKWTCDDQ